MYTRLLQNLQKIKASIEFSSGEVIYLGSPMLVLSDPTAHRPLARLYYINAVSALDDILELYISTNYSSLRNKEVDTLGKRIKYLNKKSVLSDPIKLNNFKESRNKFAHEVGEYSSWDEVRNVLKDIDKELRYMNIIS